MTNFISILLGYIIATFIVVVIKNNIDKFCNANFWSKPLNNFEFTWKGKKLWYSRACAVALFTYCKNSDGEWCILANKRGVGTPDYQGYWNCPCGYLDFSETAQEACARECHEECGINVPTDLIELVGVNSNPSSNKQNVTIRHKAVLNGTIDDWSNFTTEYNEEEETSDIKWIPLSQLDNYVWAFGHKEIIIENTPN